MSVLTHFYSVFLRKMTPLCCLGFIGQLTYRLPYYIHSLCSVFGLCEMLHLSVKDLRDGSCHKLHGWNRALIIRPDIKLKSCVFIVTQPPGMALNWNIPICFFLCANLSDQVKIWTGLSGGEAAVWSHTVSDIQCHVHMFKWLYPNFQLSCDDSNKKTGFRGKREI